MNYKDIKSLKNKHRNEDIWIILAGSSMDYVNATFFENKITIGQNQVFEHFPCDYVVMKDCMEEPRFPRSIEMCNTMNIPLIFSKYYKGNLNKGLNKPLHSNSYVFNHNPRIDTLHNELNSLDDSDIIVSKLTTTSLMHIACYMGAKNLILCGHDCGSINGKLYFDNYTKTDWVSGNNWGGIRNHLKSGECESQIVRDFLVKKYNVNIYSLNPFMNFNLDGNTYINL
jgi:hypothetical protein